MKKSLISALLGAVLLIGCTEHKERDLTELVNTLIGTEGPGNVYPGAQSPFGMVQLSPDSGRSGWYRISGYSYPDSTIAGFSHTHLSGTGAGDLYDISFMPAIAPYKIATDELGLYSTFSHKNETAHAGYYQVKLDTYDINVELTATERCGIQKYTFPKNDSAMVYLNLAKHMNWDYPMGSQIKVIDNQTIEGYRLSEGWAVDQRVYFVTKFSKPFTTSRIDTMYTKHNDPQYNNIENQNAAFFFNTNDGEQIEVRTALSPTSIESAHKNMAEIDGKDFNTVRNEVKVAWNKELAKIEVESASNDRLTVFYTALYRTMLAPVLYNNLDKSYLGADFKVHQADFNNYSTFSLWDTYRAENPLLALMHPNKTADMIESMIVFQEQSGALPVWNMWANETDMMIGYHSVPVIVEAYLKGIKVDAKRAMKAMVATANQDNYRGIGEYKEFGYIPASSHGESVSITTEYSYDDYCIARMAEKMGETDLAKEFYERGRFYKNLFNKETGFFQPKGRDGKWLQGFNPDDYTIHFTESNAWHYRFVAQQEPEEMRNLLGGEKGLEQALDNMFEYRVAANDSLPIFSTGMIGQYVQGNEPSHHIAYLYNYTENPAKMESYLHTIMTELYRNSPDGLCGNEDCGQMSAWYVFSSMGIYPQDPCSMKYELGVPINEKSVMNLSNGNKFTVLAHSLTENSSAVKEVKLNGEKIERRYITFDEIQDGATLEFFF